MVESAGERRISQRPRHFDRRTFRPACGARRCPRATRLLPPFPAATFFSGLRVVLAARQRDFSSRARNKLFVTFLAVVLGNLGRSLPCACRKCPTSASAGSPGTSIKSRSQSGAAAPARRRLHRPHRILFCAAPLGVLGAVTDGLTGDFYLLAVTGRDGRARDDRLCENISAGHRRSGVSCVSSFLGTANAALRSVLRETVARCAGLARFRSTLPAG